MACEKVFAADSPFSEQAFTGLSTPALQVREGRGKRKEGGGEQGRIWEAVEVGPLVQTGLC